MSSEVEVYPSSGGDAPLHEKSAKIQRVKSELKQSKPDKGSHPGWRHYKVYVAHKYRDFCI